ncbi:GlxA family transcriptional regulator [Kiloniella sp. EL199]|uniref:GlxA family transcriptional regulator n=1 Tax=Kiloniella sp. EL199 TaxID=2107581 RepID=UPI000EA01FCB|nr:GlxA family transcriptional regulator [Kiloniella sp. EL199]
MTEYHNQIRFEEDEEQKMTIAFLLVPDFSMMCFSSLVEPLRALNRLVGHEYFKWVFLSQDGAPVFASNGASLNVHYPMDQLTSCDAICVCTGIDVGHHVNDAILGWLRQEARKGRIMGAISTGTYFLAKAGLLEGTKCTLHWENQDSFRELFPTLEVTDRLYEVSERHFSCAGGTAAFDLALSWICSKFGNSAKTAVADQFLHGTGRSPEEPQRNDWVERYGIHNPKLLDVIRLMEDNLEEPMSRQELADTANVSVRQLERLFGKYLQSSPSLFYLQLRLERASYFLRQTAMPVSEIAVACGFISFSHFSRSYRKQFGCSPSEERVPEHERTNVKTIDTL